MIGIENGHSVMETHLLRVMIMLSIFSLLLLTDVIDAATCTPPCHAVGSQETVCDPRCSQGQSLGCDAGGQQKNCRFCFAVPTLCSGGSTASPGQSTISAVPGACNPPCHNVGNQKIFCDPRCSHGESLGCNADGQGQDCRYCWADPKACNEATTMATRGTTSAGPVTTARVTTPAPHGTTQAPYGTTTPGGNRCNGPSPLEHQTQCTQKELNTLCNCPDDSYCCLQGVSAKGCSNSPWKAPACSCACKVIPFPVPNCTWDQYLFSPCNQKVAPYYCPSSNGCAGSRFRCPDLCYLTTLPPYPPRPPNKGTYTPSNSLTPQSTECGPQEYGVPPKCAPQPNSPSWPYYNKRKTDCARYGWWCPTGEDNGWEPSTYQCGETLYQKPVCPVSKLQSQECRVAPDYSAPSWAPQPMTKTGYCDTSTDCDNFNTSSHCVGCCYWDNPKLSCYDFWQEGKGAACRRVTPRFNWIITTCDTMGGLAYGGACAENPFSTVDVRYIAVYELTKKSSGQFVWSLVENSSPNWDGENAFVDFSKLPTEHTMKTPGPIQSCSGGGGGWNAAFFPYKTDGATPPAFMFVMSYAKFENAAWFMLNQRILDGGPQAPTCKSMTNCWGEISAGEIDFLETPNLFPQKFKNEQGWKYFRTTSYNAANRCWACNHATHGGEFNVAGCGGEPADSFYNANAQTSRDKGHLWAAVIDARGTTLYKDPVWPGMTNTCTSKELVNLHPEKPAQEQPCSDPSSTCAIFLPGCVTKMSDRMTTITNGDFSRIPYCWYVDSALHTTCTENWWNLMMDTGQWMVKDPGRFDEENEEKSS